MKTIKIPRELHRAALIAREDISDNTIRLSISSDEPYLRYDWQDDSDYYEVLDHSPGGIKDERLKAGMPLLFNHSRDQVLGRSEGYETDGHKIWVTATLSTADDVRSHVQKIKESTLRDSSIGYELVGDGKKIGTKEGIPIYAFPFRIFESSIVAIPADISVGVGRQRDKTPETDLREISIIDENNLANRDNLAHTETTPTPKGPNMKVTPAVRQYFNADSGGGSGNGGEKPVDPAKAAADAIAEYKARCKKIDEWVGAIRVEAWKKKIEPIAQKHKDGAADYNDFQTEALRQCTTEIALDTPFPEQQQKQERQQGSGIIVTSEPRPKLKSLGLTFIESPEFKACNGRLERWKGIGIETKHCLIGAYNRAMASSSMFAGVNVTQQQGILMLGVQRMTIMDLLSPGTIANTSLKYPREVNLGTGGAETVGEGGQKPRWDPVITVETTDVKKVAVYTKVPDEMMADFPAFGSYVDARLPYQVDIETERQLLYGDGTGNNLLGVFNVGGIQSRPLGGDTRPDAAYNALTLIRTNAFFEPDGYVFNPLDWEQIKLLKDANNQYLGGGPFYAPYGNGTFVEFDRLWGKPVVQTTAIQQGVALAGCFKLGGQYFLREGMRLETTNSNEDDFIKNLITIRAEHRLLIAWYRPSCFVEITGV